MVKLLFVLIVVLGMAWWYFHRRAAREAAARSAADASRRLTQSSSEFHAVAIRTPATACDAARKLEGIRYLGPDAPKLPLPDCDREHCECRFQHYDDRRTGKDRRSPFGSAGSTPGTGRFQAERRQKEGRRTDD